MNPKITTTPHTNVQEISLLLDASPSMDESGLTSSKSSIESLNEVLPLFLADCRKVVHCAVEIQAISFAGDVEVENDFELVENFSPMQLQTRGVGTNLGGAVERALDEIEARRDYQRLTGLQPYQPWLVAITDGMPNVNTAPGFEQRLQDLHAQGKLLFIPVAVGDYDSYDELERVSPDLKPVRVDSANPDSVSFAEFFRFLSSSAGKSDDLKARLALLQNDG